MVEILLVVLFFWLFWKSLVLAVRVAWGTAKILAAVLFVIALPLVALCLIFAGGLLLLIPVVLMILAFFLLKACT